MSKNDDIDFGVLLNVAFGLFKRDLHRHLASRGFDDLGPSFGYVFRLLHREAHNLQGVAAALGITAQGALKIVNDMVEKGYVERRDDPDDGRVKWLELTDRARAAMAQAARFHQQYERNLARRLGEAQVGALRTVLEDMHASAQAEGFADIRPL